MWVCICGYVCVNECVCFESADGCAAANSTGNTLQTSVHLHYKHISAFSHRHHAMKRHTLQRVQNSLLVVMLWVASGH